MEETPRDSIKFVLATFDDGKNNHYYDSTFNLRVPFKPNRNGVYRFEMNEVFFKNNEPTLRKDVDWYEVNIHMNDDKVYKVRYTVTRDIYSYPDTKNFEKLLDVMRGKYYNEDTDRSSDKITAADSYLRRTPIADLDKKFSTSIKLYGSYDGTFTGKDSVTGKYEKEEYITNTGFKTCMRMEITIEEEGDHTDTDKTPQISNVHHISLTYSSNFCYLFNSLRADYIGTPTKASAANQKAANFDFYNLRTCGAYIYIVDTNVNADVKTYNANNQAYNIVAYTYNYSDVHNTPVQCQSTMTGTVADLSNFRIRVLNDQWELVPILEPVSVLCTISNSD